MLYEPEIIITPDRSVLSRIVDKKTLVACWDATNDPTFEEIFSLLGTFNESGDDQVLLAPVQELIMPEVHSTVEGMGRFNAYDDLQLWVGEAGDDMSAEAVPHRDYPCVGIFVYLNEQDLSTICIPNRYAGKSEEGGFNADALFPNADFAKAVHLPAKSVAIIKLGEQVHCSPDSIPDNTRRIVMHARYSY